MLEYYTKNIKKEGEKLIVLYGASKEKNSMSSLKRIEEVADIIFFIKANHFRAMPAEEVSEYVGYSKYPRKFSTIQFS
jgi:folylpolyglutamate synthase/dihydropteroate synthase